ncbi:MAG: hypothetical protein KME11_03145 [Timaviella obliquedivisa GSE-PSE-MK23-08B]|nr:hypothetical protein [Timaviella obliquedivisa GSE-PSE-MK23-08B]MBW4514204.1 hypothetical protein [Timaviella obliquedivisa GSE-PSE-MK23-08B]
MRRSMIPVSLPLVGSLLMIASSVHLPPSNASIVDDYCAANPYGLDGELSQGDVEDLSYLAFPQTSADMRNRFGSPKCMDARLDYYKVAGTLGWVAIEFAGSEAIGYRTWAGE